MFTAVNEFARNDAFGEYAAFVIDITEKKIKRGETLREAFFDPVPFFCGDDARKEIVGEDLFRAFLGAVDGEGNSFVKEGKVGGLLAFAKFFRRKAEQGLMKGAIVRTGQTGGSKHLVVGRVELIVHERGGYPNWSSTRRG